MQFGYRKTTRKGFVSLHKHNVFALLAFGSVIPVFILDIVLTPLGYAEWLLYLLPLLIMYRAQNPSLSFWLLGCIGVLLMAGYLITPASDMLMPALVNRLEGYLAFVVFTIVINRLIDVQAGISRSKEETMKRNNELAQAYKEMESFSYSLSHDLRAPLQSVLGFADMLREDYGNCLDEDGLKYLEWIRNSANTINRLIDDMLTLSGISHQPLSLEDVDMSAIASSIVDDLRSREPDRKVRVIIAAGLSVRADRGLMTIALSNLLGNAWKYTRKAEKPIIEFGVSPKEGETVYFVRDNGAGFDMRHAQRLFEPFRRLHSDKEFSGAGVGLATVDRVIRRHGGAVWAEGTPNKGASFYFTISP